MKSSYDTYAEQLYSGWAAVDMSFRARILPKLSELGVSMAQFEIMLILEHFGEKRLSIKDLAEASLKTSSAVTQLVGGLEKQRLIARMHAESDRRVVYVVLSQEGKKKVAQAHGNITEIMRGVTSNLSEKEMQAYIRINAKIVKNI